MFVLTGLKASWPCMSTTRLCGTSSAARAQSCANAQARWKAGCTKQVKSCCFKIFVSRFIQVELDSIQDYVAESDNLVALQDQIRGHVKPPC